VEPLRSHVSDSSLGDIVPRHLLKSIEDRSAVCMVARSDGRHFSSVIKTQVAVQHSTIVGCLTIEQ